MTPSTTRRSVATIVALVALPGAVHGCSSPTRPVDPPGGGQSIVLDFAQYQATVAPVLSRHGCDIGPDCHGSGIRGTFELSPPGAKDDRFDFDQVSMQVTPADRDHSPILTEPLALAAGGTPHGVKPFATVTDSDYVRIQAWVDAGVTR